MILQASIGAYVSPLTKIVSYCRAKRTFIGKIIIWRLKAQFERETTGELGKTRRNFSRVNVTSSYQYKA